MEFTLLLLKPDAVDRGLVGEIISRCERKGLFIAGMRFFRFDALTLERFYGEHTTKQWWPLHAQFMLSGACVALALAGLEAVAVVRNIAGLSSHCLTCNSGSVRGALGMSQRQNLVHSSDSQYAAGRELGLIFGDTLANTAALPLLYRNRTQQIYAQQDGREF